MKKLVFATAVAGSLLAGTVPSWAPPPPPPQPQPTNDTAIFVGLQWNFGASEPELVLGARNTRSDNTSSAYGGKVDFAFPLNAANWNKPVIRLMGIYGGCDIQGEVGVGYSVGDSKPLVAAGVQGPYVNGGVNMSLSQKISPYLGINTLAAPGCMKAVAPPG